MASAFRFGREGINIFVVNSGPDLSGNEHDGKFTIFDGMENEKEAT